MAMNWGQIKDAVSAYANRSDLAPLMPTFLELAEQRIYNGQAEQNIPPLRLSTMLTTVTYGSSLPSDFLEMKRVAVTMSPTYKKPLDFKPLELMATLELTAGDPSFFSMSNNALVFAPSFSQPVEIVYYARFATPVADTDTNWLTNNASLAYVSSLLIEVAHYTKDDELLIRETSRFASQVRAMQAQDEGNKHSGAQLRMLQDARRLI